MGSRKMEYGYFYKPILNLYMYFEGIKCITEGLALDLYQEWAQTVL